MLSELGLVPTHPLARIPGSVHDNVHINDHRQIQAHISHGVLPAFLQKSFFSKNKIILGIFQGKWKHRRSFLPISICA